MYVYYFCNLCICLFIYLSFYLQPIESVECLVGPKVLLQPVTGADKFIEISRIIIICLVWTMLCSTRHSLLLLLDGVFFTQWIPAKDCTITCQCAELSWELQLRNITVTAFLTGWSVSSGNLRLTSLIQIRGNSPSSDLEHLSRSVSGNTWHSGLSPAIDVTTSIQLLKRLAVLGLMTTRALNPLGC